MKILAVDFGQKRLGLAFSDINLDMVLPFGLVVKRTLTAQVRELAALINKEGVKQVVVGFPVSQNGQENKNTERVKQFVYELGKLIAVPIAYFDERFTSQAADAMGGNVTRDEKSAMQILEGYLIRNKKT
ncbi:MAG: Holliday junction resolvase RuvX [Candidatus Magasanikbacteria bacterium]|nr:Holliday junction resolvase RuvX [Candidatus Magasanikbacteria bacterium]